MTILDVSLPEVPSSSLEKILCYYRNDSRKLQIVRSANINNWRFERVVFPRERILFEAPPQAFLEIHTSATIGTILEDTIECDRLCIPQNSSNLQSCA